MKRLALAFGIWFALGSLSAHANPTVSSPVRPAPVPATSGAAQLGVEEVNLSVPVRDSSEHLNDLSQQINQGVNMTSGGGQSELRNLLNLPDNMVIQGSQRTGLQVGTEF